MDPESIKKEICWIVAGRLSEFDDYVRKKLGQYAMLRQECPYDYHYVSSVDSLRGHTDIKGFFVGSWRLRQDIAEIKQLIALSKVKSEDWRNEWISPQEGVQSGAEALAKEIDAEVLRTLIQKTPGVTQDFLRAFNGGDLVEYITKS